MMWNNLLVTAAFLWLYMTVFYLLALFRRNNAVADTAWGLGFVLIAFFNLFLAPAITPRQIAAAALVTVWGVRLAVHVHSRNLGKPEDFRYAEMRRKWGRRAPLFSYTHVFLLQGFLLLVVAFPIVLINADPSAPFGMFGILGVFVWAAGFTFEAAADYQLRRFGRFQKSPENPVMTKGLWRFSRHPNYFGEALLWWGIFLLALPVRYGWAGVLSPLAIGFLLLKVSGVPLLEKKVAADPRYQEYARRTNKFFPWRTKTG
jgi:steroid 5-alpha reductase family enzyme